MSEAGLRAVAHRGRCQVQPQQHARALAGERRIWQRVALAMQGCVVSLLLAPAALTCASVHCASPSCALLVHELGVVEVLLR